MRRIDELVAELCPDGVAFKALGDITTKGANIKWANVGDTEFRYIDLSSVDRTTRAIGETVTITAANAPSRAQQIVRAGDVIFATTRPTQMRWAVIPSEYDQQIASTGYCVMRPDPSEVLTNFLAHTLGTDTFCRYIEANQVAGNYPSIPDSRVRAHRIPVPPLEVQREIVRILDQFTQLEAELEAELEARRLQHKFYTTVLFADEGRTPFATFGELCSSITTGKLDVNAKVSGGAYPFFTCDATPYAIDTYAFDTEAILLSGNGSRVGHVNYYQGKFNAYQRTYVASEFSSRIEVGYLLHYLQGYFREYVTLKSRKGSVPYITLPMLKDFRVPVPPLEEQRRIVGVLDKFDALVNDLSVGLPAELAARRKQYEYYRDKLLAFEEAAA